MPSMSAAVGRPLMTSVAVVFAAALSACSGGPQSYDMAVSLDETEFPPGAVPSLVVDVVPLTKAELDYWSKMSVDRYLQPGTEENELRQRFLQSQKMRQLAFDQGKARLQAISRYDPFWQASLAAGATDMVVIATLPVDWRNKPIEDDPRRRILPLDSSRWGQRQINVFLHRLYMNVVPPPLAEE